MKKIILGALFLAVSSLSQAQIQSEYWLKAPQELTFYSPSGGTTNISVPTGVTAGTRGYNSVYENGSPLFYIASGKVYGVSNGVHGLLGSLDFASGAVAGDEYGIIPHPNNTINICSSKKFFIIYSIKPASGSGSTNVALVDMNANAGAGSINLVYQNLLSGNDLAHVSMAISKVRAGNERMIYLQGKVSGATTSNGLRIFKMSSSGVFSPMTHGAVPIPNTREMELTNAGDRLAYVNVSGSISVVNLSTTGLPPGAVLNIPATNPVGLEFDNTSNRLYYSDNSGIWVKDLPPSSPAATNIIPLYPGSALEKSFSDGYHPTQILCGNATSMQGIDMATNTLNMWIAAFSATLMPDQIDGEYANANLVNVGGPYSICRESAGALGISGSPALVGGFTMEIKTNFGNVLATIPFAPGGFTLPAQNVHHTYSVKVYPNGNPGCAVTRNWTIHVSHCKPNLYPTINTTLYPGYYSISAEPNDEDVVTGSAWYVSELHTETNEELFSINDPSCWQLPVTSANTFEGFLQTADNPYTGQISSIPCTATAGKFLYDRTYKITRETWLGTDPHEFYTAIVRNGEVINPDGYGEARSLGIPPVIAEETLSISPNPSTGIITIRLKEGVEKASMEVYNELGALVRIAEQTSSTAEINLADLPKGVYLLKILSEGTLTTKKLVLE